MNRIQKLGANGLIAFFLFWPIYDMITRSEDFPFGAYTMYSAMYSLKNLGDSDMTLYGVFASGDERVIREIGALDETRLRMGFKAQLKDSDGKEKISKSMLSLIRECGSACYVNGVHSQGMGKLVGLRLYRVQYDNIDELRTKAPSRRELLVEATSS